MGLSGNFSKPPASHSMIAIKTAIRAFIRKFCPWSLVLASSAMAGHGVGNGGDQVRATFIRAGEAVISYLRDTSDGQALASRAQLDIEELAGILSTEIIQTSTATLIDNTGAVVDAIGIPGHITLQSDRWLDHFEKGRDIYFLVLHEMLRAIGVDDDNYKISTAIHPFPATQKIVTRLASLYPLLNETPLSQIIDVAEVLAVGSGCPPVLGSYFLDFDEENNTMDFAFRDFNLIVGSATRQAGRKNCSVRIPIHLKQGTRLVVTQVDASANMHLAAGTKAVLSSYASFNNNPLLEPTTKSYDAAANVSGRLLIRSTEKVASSCGPGTGIMAMSVAAALSTSAAEVSSLQADRMRVYFRLESCE